MDATGLLYEIGRQVQTVALAMRQHRIVAAQQLCECGRLPARTLPVFGPRCEVASDQWLDARAVMQRMVQQTGDPIRPVGRASVSRHRSQA